jgi:hypothetical protein
MRYVYDYQYKKNTSNINSKSKSQNSMKGGALTAQQRKQYLDLCFSMKNSREDHSENTFYLVKYLKDYVSPMVPEHKVELFNQIFSVLDGILEIGEIDTNFLSVINILSLQCTILLTDYSEEARKDPNFMLYIADPYNDPSIPKSSILPESYYEEIIDVYDMSRKELLKLSDVELDELTDEILDELDDDELADLIDFYKKNTKNDLKNFLIRGIKVTSTDMDNSYYTSVFDKLIDCKWTDYFELKKHIIATPILYSLFSSLIFSKKNKEYKFPLKKNTNIYFAVILGEMTLSELLIASSKQIYFIGVVLTDSNADGYKYNPFLFFCHDIDHANGDIRDRYALYDVDTASTLNKKIIRFINLQDRKVADGSITHEKYNNIMFWLFLLAHELPNSIVLLLQTGKDPNDIFNSLLHAVLFFIRSTRFPYLFRFRNELDLGGFIPHQYRANIYKLIENGIRPNPFDNLIDSKYVPVFFKISVVDFAQAWYFIPKIREISKARSLEDKQSNSNSNSKTKSKTKSKSKSKTRKYHSI